jgi:hypothetical protein
VYGVRRSPATPQSGDPQPTRLPPSFRLVIDGLVSATLRPLDRAFDEVFERGLDVRSVDHAEEVLGAVAARESASSRVGTWVAVAATLRPVAMRMAKRTARAGRVLKFSSAGRMAAWGVTGTVAVGRVVDAARAGVSELQVMASYLAGRVRETGRRPARSAVEAAALSLYLNPSRPPDVGLARQAAVGRAARRWMLDAIKPDAEDARRRRSRARFKAIAALSDAELLRLVDVIPATVKVEERPEIDR